MPIKEGENIPESSLGVMTPNGPSTASSQALLGKGTSVVFGVPGAFTPTCSDFHLPGFVLHAEELREKGAETIACISVNDVFVMQAWGEAQHVGSSVLMLADGNGDFTRALGLEFDASSYLMGERSQRYAMILSDGVVTKIAVESGPGLDVSSAEAMLKELSSR